LRATLLFFFVSALLVLLFFGAKYYLSDRSKLLFYASVSEKGFDETFRSLKEALRPLGLLQLYETPGGVVFLSCWEERSRELLLKVPSLSYLVPCSVSLFKRGGKVFVSLPREVLFLAELKDRLTEEEISYLVGLYMELRSAVRRALKR